MVLDRALDDHLYTRLLTLEDELLDAVEADPKSMKAFMEHLSQLQVVASQGMARASLSARTLALLRQVAASGVALANHFLGVERINTNVEEKRQAQLISAFNRMSLNDDASSSTEDGSLSRPKNGRTPKASHRCPPAPRKRHTKQQTSFNQSTCTSNCGLSSNAVSDSDASSVTSHTPRAYAWLVKHIYNPYPSQSVKAKLAQETGVSVKSIEDWFSYIRRKIGWTVIVKRFFKGDRALTVDCARSVFLGEPAKFPIGKLPVDAFIAMKATAEKLSADKLGTSDIARHIDGLVKVVAEEHPPASRIGREAEGSGLTRNRKRKMVATDDTEIRAENEKHRFDSSVRTSSRPPKRSRNVYSEDSSTISTSGPASIESISPPPETLSLNADLSCRVPEHVNDPSLLVSALPDAPSRKRRLSHSDGYEPVSKRLRELPPSPQTQATTDAIPYIGDSLGEVDFTQFEHIWSTLDFNIPTDAMLGGLMPEGDVDLSIFNFPGSVTTTARIVDPFTLDNPCFTSVSCDVTASAYSVSQSQDVPVDKADEKLRLSASGDSDQSTPTRTSPLPLPIRELPLELPVDSDSPPAIPNLFFDSTESTPSPTGSYSPRSELFPELSPSIFDTDLLSTPSMLALFDDSQHPATLDFDVPSGISFDPKVSAMPSSDCVQNMLNADRVAKLERLRNLKAERSRLAEEELRLEQELISHP
ncbi:hypothetical protein DFH11DRAFT_1556795 [Phellopilus nigrolimitatus]|nr:hypothetical protein DFH11DRAFT_1556795 [Phellopilus nigrolimitatus]